MSESYLKFYISNEFLKKAETGETIYKKEGTQDNTVIFVKIDKNALKEYFYLQYNIFYENGEEGESVDDLVDTNFTNPKAEYDAEFLNNTENKIYTILDQQKNKLFAVQKIIEYCNIFKKYKNTEDIKLTIDKQGDNDFYLV